MQESSFVWAGVMAMVAVSILLVAIAWPVVDGWHDEWRDYAHGTQLGGVCSNPDPDARPDSCETDPPLERWRFIPWLLTVGLAASLLALCLPGGPGVTRDRHGRWIRRAAYFIRSQR